MGTPCTSPVCYGTIIAAGKFWQAGEASMRRHFQHGQVFSRGKRKKIWVGRFYAPALQGGKLVNQRKAVILGLCADMTKGQAQRELQRQLDPVNQGLHSLAQRLTFREFCDQWEREILPHYRPSTQQFYRATLHRWVRPHFDGWELGDIQPVDVQQFINRFGEYSQSVLGHLRATISRLFATAVKWRYLAANAAAGLELPRGKPVKRATVLTADQVRTIVCGIPEPFRTMVIVLAGTVIRESELLALKWSDLDFLERVIHVQRSIYRRVVDGETKTDESQRDIPMSETVSGALMGLRLTKFNRGEFVFTTAHGNIFAPETVRRDVFQPFSRTGAVPHFSFRSFRRTSATIMHQFTPLRTQRLIMGHASEEMSLLYTEAAMQERREAIGKLDAQLWGGQNWTQVGLKPVGRVV
jgi:integrase